MTLGVDVREIETFLVLAEELHFGKAAKRLFVSSARVSQTIRELERRIGAALFERTTRRVALTPDGQRLRNDILPAYSDLRAAFDEIRARAGGIDGPIRIGYVASVAVAPLMTLVGEFRKRHPGYQVIAPIRLRYDALGALRRSEVDVFVTWWPGTPPATGHLDLRLGPVLASVRPALTVAADHPLATRDQVCLEDLADYPVLESVENMTAALGRTWLPAATPGGRPIRRVARLISGRLEEAIAQVASGDVVYPALTPVPDAYRTEAVSIPIGDLSPCTVVPVWLGAAETARVHALTKLAKEVAARRPDK